jgi:hypothetical protein
MVKELLKTVEPVPPENSLSGLEGGVGTRGLVDLLWARAVTKLVMDRVRDEAYGPVEGTTHLEEYEDEN